VTGGPDGDADGVRNAGEVGPCTTAGVMEPPWPADGEPGRPADGEPG
jgi:hypothetical protein